jgi:hypothetical protein
MSRFFRAEQIAEDSRVDGCGVHGCWFSFNW